MAGTVSGGAGALHGLFAVVGGVAAEGTLVDGAVGVAVERHAEVFQLVHHLGCFTAHELDGVLVAQPVGALDGVVEVVVPVVFGTCCPARRTRHLVRPRCASGWGRLWTARPRSGLHGTSSRRGTHARAACADDDDVKLARGDIGFCIAHFLPSIAGIRRRHRTWKPQPAQPTSQTMVKTCRARRRPTGWM